MGANLTFPNPNMEQKELISLLKQQASKQGVHLTTVTSSANSEAHYGRFFKLACNRFRGRSNHKQNKNKDVTTPQSTEPPPLLQLYNPNVKIGTLRTSKITRGLEGKKLPRKRETTKSKKTSERCSFNFTLRLCFKTDSWVLSSCTGSCEHMFHPKPMSALLPTLRETPETVKTQALEFLEATNSPATAATITSFRTGLELTSSQLNYLKRKKDNREGIKHKSSEDDLLT